MKIKPKFRKLLKWSARIIVYGFAFYGLTMSATYLAVKYKWTNVGGVVDRNNPYFEVIQDRKVSANDPENGSQQDLITLRRILILEKFYPENARKILKVYKTPGQIHIAIQMLDATDLRLKNNAEYRQEMKRLAAEIKQKGSPENLFEWMNVPEWQAFKEAVVKDRAVIDSVAEKVGVEPRLIIACLVGEQMRLFNSSREGYKRYMEPLKVLAMESNFSFGVTGLKPFTVRQIENHLIDKNSEFYLGEAYENLLDYDSLEIENIEKNGWNDTLEVRLKRLVQFKNHYYSYLYTAVFLKQIKTQWEKAGFDIGDRPEILATLFNLGFNKSKPNPNPKVGGSRYQIGQKYYSFGAVAYEFFYSGELLDVYPYKMKSFDWAGFDPAKSSH